MTEPKMTEEEARDLMQKLDGDKLLVFYRPTGTDGAGMIDIDCDTCQVAMFAYTAMINALGMAKRHGIVPGTEDAVKWMMLATTISPFSSSDEEVVVEEVQKGTIQ